MIKPEELTVVVPSKNGNLWTLLSIRSFQYINPEYKDRIMYFDDESTDNTVELIKNENIPIITWTYQNNDFPEEDMLIRVSKIYESISKQCSTKYLLFLDCDTVSIDKEAYIEAFAQMEYYKLTTEVSDSPRYYAIGNRFTYNFLLLDNDYFKANNIFGIYYNTNNYFDKDYDVGEEFYNYCVSKKIPFKHINYREKGVVHIYPNPINYFSVAIQHECDKLYMDTVKQYELFKKSHDFEKIQQISDKVSFEKEIKTNFKKMYKTAIINRKKAENKKS